jgi:hypothetical protein
MTRCIYCCSETSESESIEHPLPESLGSRLTLPRGACCDGCNRYLSSLDDVFAHHPHIAGTIVFARIPGKKQKRRTAVSPFLGAEYSPGKLHLTVENTKGETHFDQGGLRLHLPDDPKWDEWKFSRALHKAALGLVGVLKGVELALDQRFDAVRKYIRRPVGRTDWRPYYQRVIRTKTKLSEIQTFMAGGGEYKVGIASGDRPGHTIVYLNLWVDEFVVDLEGGEPGLGVQVLDQMSTQISGDIPIENRGMWMKQPGAQGMAVGE